MSANNVLLFVFAATEALTAQIQPDIVQLPWIPPVYHLALAIQLRKRCLNRFGADSSR